MTRKVFAALVGVLLSTLVVASIPLLPATAAAIPAHRSHRFVDAYCTSAASTPVYLALECRYGGVVLHDLSWRTWGHDSARGSGSLTANSCRPGCAVGKIKIYSVHLVLSDPVRCADAKLAEFQRAAISFNDARPGWSKAHLPTVWPALGCAVPLPRH